MHPQSLAHRTAQAKQRIINDIEALASSCTVPIPPTIRIQRGNPRVRDLQFIEGVAQFLDGLLAHVNAGDGASGEVTMGHDAPASLDPATDLMQMVGVGKEVAAAMVAAGIASISDVRDATDERLLAIPGIGPRTLERIRAQIATMEVEA